MKRQLKVLAVTAMTTALTAMMSLSAFASAPITHGAPDTWSNGGCWSADRTIWQANDGTQYHIGDGPTFSEEHPEITDPEYFLKDYINYPGEDHGYSRAGNPKASPTEGTLPLLQEFVNSFDWIHSTELERFKAVYERIGAGYHGNIYSNESRPPVSYSVLETGKGMCGDYSSEFTKLASYVGLESVDYIPWFMHSRNMVKLNGYWFSTDPSIYSGVSMFSNGRTFMVDYETELNRYANEVKETDWYKKQMQDAANQAEWQKQLDAGQITEMEYRRLLFPDLTDEEINERYSWDGYVDGLGN